MPESLVVPGHLDALADIRQYVTQAAHESHLERKDTYRLCLAVDEIATNAVLHGYDEAGREGMLRVTAIIDRQSLTIMLEDNGIAFNPFEHFMPTDFNEPAENRRLGGMGIYLARNAVDIFDYEHIDGVNRNIFVVHRPSAVMDQDHVLVINNRDTDFIDQLHELGYQVSRTPDELSATMTTGRAQRFVFIALFADNTGVGDAIIRRLRNVPALRHTPILVVAYVETLDAVMRYMEQGADEYIVLPKPQPLLKARIESCLVKRHSANPNETELRRMSRLADNIRQVILPLGIALSEERDFDQLLERFVTESMRVCNADGGTLYLKEGNDLHFTIVITHSLGIRMGGKSGVSVPYEPLTLHDPQTGEPNHANVATHVALTGQAINIRDIYNASRFDFSATRDFDLRNGYQTISCLGIPLKQHHDTIGVLQIINPRHPITGDVVPFDGYHQLIVETLAAETAVALNVQYLLKRQEELLTYQRDIQIGRQIQADFLPDRLPVIPGWEISSVFNPSREVAGDFYDAFTIGRGMVGLIIADVTDKGVGAALFMALIRSLLRAFIQQAFASNYGIGDDPVARQFADDQNGDAPPDVQTALGASALRSTLLLTNEYILYNHGQLGMFATVFFGVLDPATGLLMYINAGHDPPIVLRSHGGIVRLDPTGPAVGLMPHSHFALSSTVLDPGEMLLAFTDGVTEARSTTGEFYGVHRLLTLIQSGCGGSVEEMRQCIEDDLQRHLNPSDQNDDVTLLLVQRLNDS